MFSLVTKILHSKTLSQLCGGEIGHFNIELKSEERSFHLQVFQVSFQANQSSPSHDPSWASYQDKGEACHAEVSLHYLSPLTEKSVRNVYLVNEY